LLFIFSGLRFVHTFVTTITADKMILLYNECGALRMQYAIFRNVYE